MGGSPSLVALFPMFSLPLAFTFWVFIGHKYLIFPFWVVHFSLMRVVQYFGAPSCVRVAIFAVDGLLRVTQPALTYPQAVQFPPGVLDLLDPALSALQQPDQLGSCIR